MTDLISPKLIIGLGNPDPDLLNTYHNVGTLAIEVLAASAAPKDEEIKWKRHKDLFEYTKLNGRVYIKPLVYMNDSGLAVKEAMKVFNISSTDTMIIHDESDLPIGSVKFSSSGGAAGHKGILSIIDHTKKK